jgi:hypothetical protein
MFEQNVFSYFLRHDWVLVSLIDIFFITNCARCRQLLHLSLSTTDVVDLSVSVVATGVNL